VSAVELSALSTHAASVCPGEEPSWVCEFLLEVTGNERLARGIDLFIARPGRILIIILLALAASILVRRFVRKLVVRMREPGGTGKIGQAVGRTVGRSLFDDKPETAARRRQRADAIGGLARGAALFVIWAVTVFLVLDEIGVNVGPLIAGAGVLGLAVGFGAQNLVRDLLAGVFMLVEDQYGVGDVVNVGVTSGVVEAVGLRVTRVRDVNGVLWHVPNGTIEAVGNMSQEWSRALLDVEVAYGTDIAHAKRVIKDVADGMWRDDHDWSDLLLAEPEIWGVESLGTNGITIRLVVRTKPIEQWNVARELRARLITAFQEEGIEIPFAQQVVWLRHDDEDDQQRRANVRSAPSTSTEPESPAETRHTAKDQTVRDAANEGDRMPPPAAEPGGPEGGPGGG
jgi:moderate conductance mechanosensitive channel